MKNKNTAIVTTSWDDGYKLDTKVAELLDKYGFKGTFYVSPKSFEFKSDDLLSKSDIKSLSINHEIGAHTINHPHLSQVPINKAKSEIIDSKNYLEEIIQREIQSFCYPYGDYNEEVKTLVKDAGYKLARTVHRYSFDFGNDRFAIPTTIHAYNHYSDINKIFNFSNHSVIKSLQYWNWDKLAIAMFDHAYNTGGVFHIWSHSWEVEKLHNWEKLEKVFSYISSKNNVIFKTNGDLIK